MLGARTERPEDDKFVIDDDMDSDTVTESNLSHDRLWKMHLSPEDSMQDSNKRPLIWWMFMSSTLEASVFMEKN